MGKVILYVVIFSWQKLARFYLEREKEMESNGKYRVRPESKVMKGW